jgi:hypothetical protein
MDINITYTLPEGTAAVLHKFIPLIKASYDINGLKYSDGVLTVNSNVSLNASDEAAIKTIIDEATVVTSVYNANTLISWAMQQLFTAELIPHFAAFLDFANKANDESKANFLAYATAVDLLETANTIVSKAMELGANITSEVN